MNIVMLKYLNLFNVDPVTTDVISELLMHPPKKLESNANPSMSNLPTTQQLTTSIDPIVTKKEFQDLQKEIMVYPSITFTRTMVT